MAVFELLLSFQLYIGGTNASGVYSQKKGQPLRLP